MGRKAVTGWVPATLCRGDPLGHTDPSPAFALHRYGYTALHWAAEHGHLPAVRALIRAGAPLDIQTYGRWALLWRAGRRGAEIGGGSARASAAAKPPLMPPSPAGARRCTSLPSTATPTQWPRCSAPARTRPSRTTAGNAVPRRHGPPCRRPPCRRCPAGGRQSNSHKRLGRAARTRQRWYPNVA